MSCHQVAKEVEVKAKIILQFKDVKGQVVTAHRNLVGTQKVGCWQKIDDQILLLLLNFSQESG